VLLHADLRPDDRVLVAAGPPWPWLLARRYRTQVVLASSPPLLSRAAEEQATILVADAGMLAEAAFQRPGRRPDLSRLRCVVALGGPLAPEARARVYTWLKSDVLLLARAGHRLWGSPLDPVPSRPGPPLSFFRPPPPAPAPA
jgi:acyl-coenzyme A synthetase/AMP-(fatty) acid ligase